MRRITKEPRSRIGIATKPPVPTEHDEQARVVAWLRFHGVLHFAVPNGARVRPSVARKLTAEGMVAGAPDLMIFPGSGVAIALEMKRVKGGRVSAEQGVMLLALEKARIPIVVGNGHEHAIGQLKAMGVGR